MRLRRNTIHNRKKDNVVVVVVAVAAAVVVVVFMTIDCGHCQNNTRARQ